jgi:phage terminase small subunit
VSENLTPKQQLFVREYLVDLNATQAAIRAGYAEHTAQQMGSENLSKPVIADAIAVEQAKRLKRVEIEADWVLQAVARRAKTGMSKFVKIDEWGQPRINLSNATPEELDCLIEASTEEVDMGSGDTALPLRKSKIKLASQDKNLELLMRHLGLLNDKLNVNFGDMSDEEFKAFGKKIFGESETPAE